MLSAPILSRQATGQHAHCDAVMCYGAPEWFREISHNGYYAMTLLVRPALQRAVASISEDGEVVSLTRGTGGGRFISLRVL